MNHRSENGRPGALTHSRYIGNANFAKDLCETPAAIVPRNKPSLQNKDSRPLFWVLLEEAQRCP
jgi:hypothetical protein